MKDIRKCSRCGEKVDRKNMAFLSDDNFKTGHLVCWHCWEMLGGREEELKEKKKGSGKMTREEAKQVELEGDGFSDGEIVYDYGKCPSCGWNFEKGDKDWEEPFCCHCGQKLKWFAESEE